MTAPQSRAGQPPRLSTVSHSARYTWLQTLGDWAGPYFRGWELLSRRARTGPQSRVVSPPTPDRYSVILPPNWNRGRQILVGVSLCESDLSADDVSHEAEEPRVREISTDGAETRDHVSHQRLVGADFAGYTFRIELGHGRTLVRSDIHDAMQLGPRSVTHATSRGVTCLYSLGQSRILTPILTPSP